MSSWRVRYQEPLADGQAYDLSLRVRYRTEYTDRETAQAWARSMQDGGKVEVWLEPDTDERVERLLAWIDTAQQAIETEQDHRLFGGLRHGDDQLGLAHQVGTWQERADERENTRLSAVWHTLRSVRAAIEHQSRDLPDRAGPIEQETTS